MNTKPVKIHLPKKPCKRLRTSLALRFSKTLTMATVSVYAKTYKHHKEPLRTLILPSSKEDSPYKKTSIICYKYLITFKAEISELTRNP